MRRKSAITSFFLSLTLLLTSGCFSNRFERDLSPLEPVQLREHFFFLGLLGEGQIDLVQQCPRGVAEFWDRFTFGDMFFTVATAGIYSPKSVFVRCAT